MLRVLESQAPKDSIKITVSHGCPVAHADYTGDSEKVRAFVSKMNSCDCYLILGPLMYIPALLAIFFMLVSCTWVLIPFRVYSQWNGYLGVLSRIMEWPARVTFWGREKALAKHRLELLPDYLAKSYFEGTKTHSIHSELKRVCRARFPEGRIHAAGCSKKGGGKGPRHPHSDPLLGKKERTERGQLGEPGPAAGARGT